jgi:hypothetical protein
VGRPERRGSHARRWPAALATSYLEITGIETTLTVPDASKCAGDIGVITTKSKKGVHQTWRVGV